MTHALRRPSVTVVSLLTLTLAISACASAAPSVAPSAVPTVAPATPTVAPTSTPAATASPTPTATPVAIATPSAAASTATCSTVQPQTGALPSDRLTSMAVQSLPDRDIARFEFGSPSLTPAGPPVGSLDVAVPPFTEGASGKTIDVVGQQALLLVFRGMSLQNDVGQPTLADPREIRSTSPGASIRHVIVFDESEGQLGLYIGYDGAGCVTLSREGMTILLTVQH